MPVVVNNDKYCETENNFWFYLKVSNNWTNRHKFTNPLIFLRNTHNLKTLNNFAKKCILNSTYFALVRPGDLTTHGYSSTRWDFCYTFRFLLSIPVPSSSPELFLCVKFFINYRQCVCFFVNCLYFVIVFVLFVSEFVFMVSQKNPVKYLYVSFAFVSFILFLCYWAIKLTKLWRLDGFMIIFYKLLFLFCVISYFTRYCTLFLFWAKSVNICGDGYVYMEIIVTFMEFIFGGTGRNVNLLNILVW